MESQIATVLLDRSQRIRTIRIDRNTHELLTPEANAVMFPVDGSKSKIELPAGVAFKTKGNVVSLKITQ